MARDFSDVPYFTSEIDLARYGAARRKINRLYRHASPELHAYAINFAYSDSSMLKVPAAHVAGWSRRKAAMDRLLASRRVRLVRQHWHDLTGEGGGTCCVYHWDTRAELRLRLPAELLVTDECLVAPLGPPSPGSTGINLIPRLETYAGLIGGARLSRSDGGQVRPTVDLVRSGEWRLYAKGAKNYQSRIPKKARKGCLLIGGEATVELDFPAMHANLLLNREGRECDAMLYEGILGRLGVRRSRAARSALKPVLNCLLNCGDPGLFSWAAWSMREDSRAGVPGAKLMDLLGAEPMAVLAAVLEIHPALAPYACPNEELWRWLQHEESEIMIDVLETLAEAGAVGLPVHDSVIVPARHEGLARRAVAGCYRRRTGFEIPVK